MKYIFFILFPFYLFCQTEQQEKLSIRKNSNISVSGSEPSVKTQIREETRYNKNTVSQNNINQLWYFDNLNNDWQSPIGGFRSFYPYFYYDRFGLRHPSRIYNMNDGTKQEIKKTRQHWRLGLSFNTKNQIGGWIGYGNSKFILVEYSSFINNDESSFIPGLTMDKVLSWNDKKLDDISLGGTLYVGGGLKFNQFGVYICPGYSWEINNYQYFDEFYILSNNGKYSFPNYERNFFTGKIGVIMDYKFLTTKLDYNPFENYINLGVGIVL